MSNVRKLQRKAEPLGIPTPRGIIEDGCIYFHEDDLIKKDDRISLLLLPVGDILLMMDPAHYFSKKSGRYQGQLVHIFYNKDSVIGYRSYRCKYRMKEDNDGNALQIFQIQ